MSPEAEPRPAGPGGAPAQQRALRSQGRRTLRKLLAAGLKVFDERGYQAARVDDVVRTARASHGTFYLYFANKEDLFRVLAEECVTAMAQLADDFGPVEPGPAGRAAVREWLASFVDTYRRYGPVIRAWAEAQLDNRELARLGGRSMQALTSRIADRVAEREGGVDPTAAAFALMAMVERLNYYVLSRQIAVDDDALLDTLAAMVHSGIFGGDNGNGAVRAGGAPARTKAR